MSMETQLASDMFFRGFNLENQTHGNYTSFDPVLIVKLSVLLSQSRGEEVIVRDRSRSVPSLCLVWLRPRCAGASATWTDGYFRMTSHRPHLGSTTIFYFLDGTTLVARQRPVPPEMRPDQFLLPPSLPASSPLSSRLPPSVLRSKRCSSHPISSSFSEVYNHLPLLGNS